MVVVNICICTIPSTKIMLLKIFLAFRYYSLGKILCYHQMS